jgi:hypothetical protein
MTQPHANPQQGTALSSHAGLGIALENLLTDHADANTIRTALAANHGLGIWLDDGGVRCAPLPTESAGESAAVPLAVLRPVVVEGQSRLLLVAPELPFAVNGHRAPRLLLLEARDEVHWEHGLRFVVTEATSYLGPPLERHARRSCLCCRTPVTDAARIYECPTCLAVLHAEDSSSEPLALPCWRESPTCMQCSAPIADAAVPGAQP